MTTEKTETIESAIVEAIKGGAKRAKTIELRLAAKGYGNGLGFFRVVDRGLQRLRKKGLIKYHSAHGWTVRP
jgi:7-keto-8-aminopelargonate synthetase-like enzyme